MDKYLIKLPNKNINDMVSDKVSTLKIKRHFQKPFSLLERGR